MVVHHGKTDCIKALTGFQNLGVHGKVVMLATAGSIGEGVNLSMTTSDGKEAVRLLCIDYPFTHSGQTQLEGRIKRPLAQEAVEKWHIHRVSSSATVRHNGVNKTHDTVDQALLRAITDKEFAADDVFMSEEELENQMASARASTYGDNARASMKSLLLALLDVCSQWADTEDPEAMRLRLQKTAERREEFRKRKREQEEQEEQEEQGQGEQKVGVAGPSMA